MVAVGGGDVMRNQDDIASALSSISPAIKFHALKLKREIERDIPEMRDKLVALGDDLFIVEFDQHVRSCVVWQGRTYPIVWGIGGFLLSVGIVMQKELNWYLLAGLYVCAVCLVAERYMRRFIQFKCRKFYGQFIAFDMILAELAKADSDDSPTA